MRAVYINAVGARSSRSKDVTATQAKPARSAPKTALAVKVLNSVPSSVKQPSGFRLKKQKERSEGFIKKLERKVRFKT